jgi:hypothetical protein
MEKFNASVLSYQRIDFEAKDHMEFVTEEKQ